MSSSIYSKNFLSKTDLYASRSSFGYAESGQKGEMQITNMNKLAGRFGQLAGQKFFEATCHFFFLDFFFLRTVQRTRRLGNEQQVVTGLMSCFSKENSPCNTIERCHNQSTSR